MTPGGAVFPRPREEAGLAVSQCRLSGAVRGEKETAGGLALWSPSSDDSHTAEHIAAGQESNMHTDTLSLSRAHTTSLMPTLSRAYRHHI